MSRFTLTPRAFCRLALISTILVAFIIVTGGAVRVTGSGLGCPDWPTCSTNHFTPRSATDYHAMIEFVNRAITGLVSVVVIVAVLGALFRRPRRRDLTWLSAGLVFGVIAQIILGAAVVEFDLKPSAVISHFLVSIALLACALVLYDRSKYPDGAAARPRLAVPNAVRNGAMLMTFTAGVVLVLGTIVTAAGPHGGDDKAPRLAVPLEEIARIHSLAVWTLLASTILTFVLLRRLGGTASFQRRMYWVFVLVIAQGALGYIQYFNNVPAQLVLIHIGGAVCVFSAVVQVLLACWSSANELSLGPNLRRTLAGAIPKD
jgi:cytochrome c oxidase assembly protein subunit 15